MTTPTTTVPQNGAPARSWAQVASIPKPLQQVHASKATNTGPVMHAPHAAASSESQQKDEADLFGNLTLNEVSSAAVPSNGTESKINSSTNAESSPSSPEPEASTEAPSSILLSEDNGVQDPEAPSDYRLRHAYKDLKLLKGLKGQENITYVAIDIETDFFKSGPAKSGPAKSGPAESGAPTSKDIWEVGASFWDGKSSANKKIQDETYHWIISEYWWKKNTAFKGGAYNHKNDFFGKSRASGKSQRISEKKIGAELMYWIKESEKNGEVVIVLHGGRSDLVDIARLQCDISHLKVLDTQLIDQAMFWEKHHRFQQPQSLKNLLHDVGYTPNTSKIPFHNAGNDSFYTMTAFVRLKAEVHNSMA